MAPVSVRRRTDRQLGWLISLCAVVMIGGRIPLILEQVPLFAPWWTTAGLFAVSLVAVSAVGGLVLPLAVLRPLWGGASALTLVLLWSTAPAYTGPGDPPVPWLWSLEPVTVSLPILLAPVPIAVAGALASGLSVAASSMLFLGHVPHDILVLTPLHVSNLAFLVIFLGMRIQLTRLREAEEAARRAAEESALARATADSRERLGALIHDEVLAVLNAAMLFDGPTPDVLQAEADTAISVLHREPGAEPAGYGPAESVARLAAAAARTWSDSRVTTLADGEGPIPAGVVAEVGHAMGEAIRNARRHSGADDVDVTVSAIGTGLTVRVADAGRGFDPATVADSRLGLRHSIQRRMELIGGTADVASAPGNGTEVVLRWRT